MFYVYRLVDPRSDLPFYIGKGKEGRAQSHLLGKSDLNKRSKIRIEEIRTEGCEPVIDLIFKSEDEDLCYDVEEGLIRSYGRFGYENDGILLNISIDRRPPSAKGKSYQDRYGDQAEKVISKFQISYQRWKLRHGKKVLTEDHKSAISRAVTGDKNPFWNRNHSDDSKRLIGDANRGRLSGSKNHKAKTFWFVSPEKMIYQIIGSFIEFCNQNTLKVATMEKAMRDMKIPKSGACAGWMVFRGNGDSGLDPYSGLLDMFEAKGLFVKDGNKLKYEALDGTEYKKFRKQIDHDLLDLVMLEFPTHMERREAAEAAAKVAELEALAAAENEE